MGSLSYGLEYFSGANVVVSIGDIPILEAAGLEVSIQESNMPIYGYSSRHWDMMASGNVLVKGVLLLNYIHQDYLYKVIELDQTGELTEEQLPEIISSAAPNQAAWQQLIHSQKDAAQVIQQLKDTYWTQQSLTSRSRVSSTLNPLDIMGGINITAVFGNQNAELPAGQTAFMITGVKFIGRSISLRPSEDVIVEAHSFLGRNIYSLRNVPLQLEEQE